MSDKRLIAGKMIDAEGEVCAIGALAKHKGRDLVTEVREQRAAIGIDRDDDEFEGDGEMEEIGVELGMPRLVAWKIVALNDIEIDGEYERIPGPTQDRWNTYGLQVFVPATPEERYEKVLAWVRRQLIDSKAEVAA